MAGWLQFVIAALIALVGVFYATVAFAKTPDEIMAMVQQSQTTLPREFEADPKMAVEMMRVIAATVGILGIVVGLGLMILSSPVRAGRGWAALTSLILVIAIDFVVLLFLGGTVLAGLAAPPMLAFACCLSIPLGLMALLTVWLFRAQRAAAVMAGRAPAPMSMPMVPGQMVPEPIMPTVEHPQAFPATMTGPAEPQAPATAPYPPEPPPGQPPIRYGYATRVAPGTIAPPTPPSAEPSSETNGGTLPDDRGR